MDRTDKVEGQVDTGLGSFFDLRTWILAVIGVVILLLVYRLVTGRRAPRRKAR